MADRSPFFGLARIFHELPSRDRETGNPLAGLSGAQRARKQMDLPPGNRRVFLRLAQDRWARGVLEHYVAGSDSRGRPEGSSYLRSQQATREISGLKVAAEIFLPSRQQDNRHKPSGAEKAIASSGLSGTNPENCCFALSLRVIKTFPYHKEEQKQTRRKT